MAKCSMKKGGYAENICDALMSVSDIFPTKKSKGIYRHTIVNLKTGDLLGQMVKVKQGDHLAEGLVFNYCPFCGGKLRDTSQDGE